MMMTHSWLNTMIPSGEILSMMIRSSSSTYCWIAFRRDSPGERFFKRENFRSAFDNFNPEKIAQYTEKDQERLLGDAGIIRNRLKIKAAITNAQAVLEIKDEFGSFDKYIWGFTDHKTIKGSRTDSVEGMQTSSSESDAMAKDLKARGFKFVGTTICYAFMQAVGMVDDHLSWCFRSNS